MGIGGADIRHLILVGLPGSGKTTVGILLGEKLDRPCWDVDRLIEEKIGRTIVEIWKLEGESSFREKEMASVLELVAAEEPSVISPGGGWAAQDGALESVAEKAVTVYLQTSPSVAAARTDASEHRPILHSGEKNRNAVLESLFEARKRRYEQCDVTVNTDERTPEDVSIEVARLARTLLG